MSEDDSPSEPTAASPRVHVAAGSDGRLNRLVVVYRPWSGQRRRVRYEPRTDGPGWWRVDDEWTGCVWRPVGREVIEAVDVEVETDG